MSRAVVRGLCVLFGNLFVTTFALCPLYYISPVSLPAVLSLSHTHTLRCTFFASCFAASFLQDRWSQLRTNAQLVVALRTLSWCPRDDRACITTDATAPGALAHWMQGCSEEEAGVACFATQGSLPAGAPIFAALGSPEPLQLTTVASLLHPYHRLLTTVFSGARDACVRAVCKNPCWGLWLPGLCPW